MIFYGIPQLDDLFLRKKKKIITFISVVSVNNIPTTKFIPCFYTQQNTFQKVYNSQTLIK